MITTRTSPFLLSRRMVLASCTLFLAGCAAIPSGRAKTPATRGTDAGISSPTGTAQQPSATATPIAIPQPPPENNGSAFAAVLPTSKATAIATNAPVSASGTWQVLAGDRTAVDEF